MRIFVFLTLFLLLPSHAAKVGEAYLNNDGDKFVIEEELGQGFFGKVWRVADPRSGEKFAAKFFKSRRASETTFRMYSRIASLQSEGKLPHVLHVYPQELFFPLSPAPSSIVKVVRSRLAVSNAEKMQDRFLLVPGTRNIDRVRKMLLAQQLMFHIIDAIQELNQEGLNHNDVNPRNMLWTGEGFILGDVDEVRPHGKRPRKYAFENLVAPLEFEDEDYGYNDDNTSDLHQLANSLYFLLFGEYRLEEMLKAQPGFENIPRLREYLVDEVHRRSFNYDLNARLRELEDNYFPFLDDLPSSQRKSINQVFDFLRAGLILDGRLRGHALSQLPFLNDFPLEEWMIESRPRSRSLALGMLSSVAACLWEIADWGLRR